MNIRRPLTSSIACLLIGCAPAAAPDCPTAPSPPPPPSDSAPTPEPIAPQPEATAALAKAPATTPAESLLHPEYVKSLARIAYVWGYPMVNMLNRRTTLSRAPEPSLLNGVLPVAPQGQIAMLHDYISPLERAVACPNQDVVYGLGFFDLDQQPVILQVPDFGERFWVYALYDARTEQIGELGKPYGSKPGFYALVGPNYRGEIPKGVSGVFTSSTSLANAIPRVFMNDTPEDRAAIQPLINQIVVYPFDQFTGEMKTKVWKDIPTIQGPNQSKGETKWVEPETFFDRLPTVLDIVPPLPGEEALYAQLRNLLEVAKRDASVRTALLEAAKEVDRTLIADFIQWKFNGVPAGNGWNRSKHNAEWGLDYYNRVGTSKSNIFDNRPSETQYFYTDVEANGAQLSGASSYAITFPKGELPPVNGFWSLTLYDEAHFFYQNSLGRFSLGTKNQTLRYNADGSLTLYVGHRSPGKEQESNWLPAPPGKFSLYLRAYWGQKGITDGTWKPPVIAKK